MNVSEYSPGGAPHGPELSIRYVNLDFLDKSA